MYPTLGLIDYGMGNLHSVNQSMKRLGQQPRSVRNREDLIGVDALILPGVGAFDPAMANLTATGLVPHLQDWVSDDRPLLGICLGLQLLFEGSDEDLLGNTNKICSRALRIKKTHLQTQPFVY